MTGGTVSDRNDGTGNDDDHDDRSWVSRNLAYPVTRFGAVLVVVWTTVALSARLLPMNAGYPAPPASFRGGSLLGGWVRYDAGWYINIADGGYWYIPGQMSTVAFFPTYPLVIRFVHALLPFLETPVVGILVTAASGLVSAVLLYRWARLRVAEPVARTAVLLVLVYPYAWYLFGAIYADALFLVCVLGAFLLVEHDRPVLAGILAIAATAARPVGTGVILGLVAITLERREIVVLPFIDRVRVVGWRGAWREWRGVAVGRPAAEGPDADRPGTDRPGTDEPVVTGPWAIAIRLSRVRPRDLGVLLSVAGLAAWMFFLRAAFANPFLFATIQSVPGWNQGQGPRVWIKGPWLRGLSLVPTYLGDLTGVQWDAFIYTVGTTFQAVLVISALCLVPLVIRRMGWGYALYVIGVIGIPLLGSKDWQGTGRYLLAAFPVVVVVASWMHERRSARFRAAWMAASAFLLLFLSSAFARGFYLA